MQINRQLSLVLLTAIGGVTILAQPSNAVPLRPIPPEVLRDGPPLPPPAMRLAIEREERLRERLRHHRRYHRDRDRRDWFDRDRRNWSDRDRDRDRFEERREEIRERIRDRFDD